MQFLEQLTTYLRQTENPVARGQTIGPSRVEPAWARNQLLHALEKLESKESEPRNPIEAPFGFGPHSRLAWLHDKWLKRDAVVRFSQQLERLLTESFARGFSAQQTEALIGVAIERQVGLSSELQSKVRTLELDRLAKVASSRVFNDAYRHLELDVPAYAEQIRAVRVTENTTSLTQIGQVYLELKGFEAVRWLTLIETIQSQGVRDPWRLRGPNKT
ncbi:hypothetical protein VZQ01_04315 [Myxococcus faecalis]|uniref:hypothetical protein n=1 Tax=Myxococcus faecalis TaxID=3115646 RepID=UPI003CF1BB3D